MHENKRWQWMGPVLVAAIACGLAGIYLSAPQGETATATVPAPVAGSDIRTLPPAGTAAPDVSFTSIDGSQTFSVPQPGDPIYADYLEMLQHPNVRSSLAGSPGFAMPYDPEWRSMVTGRRQVAVESHALHGGGRSLEDLAHRVLDALQARDSDALFAIRIDEHEFGDILWPEFPQSRPYLKIPLWEAWGFNHAKGLSGIRSAMQEFGGRKLELVAVRTSSVRPFTNFELLQDLRIEARDLDTGERVDVDIIPAVVECNGRFKALNYAG